MPKLAFWRDLVTDKLLELFNVRESTLRLAIPNQYALAVDLKDPTGPGDKGNFANFFCEGRQQLLRVPGGSQQPLTLAAIMNFNAR